jgi:DNA-binding protein HU-beta
VNKGDIARIVAYNEGITIEKSNRIVSLVFKAISEKIADDNVVIVGFGTFSKSERKRRTGRNPKNGEPIEIPAKTVPVFRPGKELKEKVKAE